MSSPVLSWELSQKPMKGKNITWAWRKCFDAAKRKFGPKEIFLKTNSEAYWEQVETDERNFSFFSECCLNLGRKMVGEERAGLDMESLVWMS